jgi:CBS domain-containing protein
MKSLDTLLLSDITTRRVLGVTGDCPMTAAARRMGETRVSCLVVMEGTMPCGIITERDLVRLLHRRPRPGLLVADIAKMPVVTAPVDLDFRSAYVLVRQRGIRHLIAVNHDGTLAGVATATDFRLRLGLDGFREITDSAAFLDPFTATLPPEALLAEALEHMVQTPWDYVLVVKGEKPLGILTERDIPLLLAADVQPDQVSLHEVMSTPVHSIPPGATVAEASARMAKLRIRHVAVVGGTQRLIGMISQDALMEKLGIEIFHEIPAACAVTAGGRNDAAIDPALVLEATGMCTCQYDAVADRLWWSRNAPTVLRCVADGPPTALAGWTAMIHPEDRHGLPSHLRIARVHSDDHLQEVECRLRTRDNTWQRVRIRSRATRRDEQGCVLEVVATLATIGT